ncbi:MAG: hypothetical protein FWC55_10610 [Firmicutes bacterium]|nr:hypothetical protein [Bacillota bacterium]
MTNGKAILCLALSAAILSSAAAGATFAWLSGRTGEANNKFTLIGANGMTAEIREIFDDSGDSPAKSARPGSDIQKVVRVLNNSSYDVDEWVAVRLTFLEGDGVTPADMGLLNGVIDTSFGPDNRQYNDALWVRKDGGPGEPLRQTEIFYYNAKLPQNGLTEALIDCVRFSGEAGGGDLDTIKNVWNGFVIKVDGAVAQGEIGERLGEGVRNELDSLF